MKMKVSSYVMPIDTRRILFNLAAFEAMKTRLDIIVYSRSLYADERFMGAFLSQLFPARNVNSIVGQKIFLNNGSTLEYIHTSTDLSKYLPAKVKRMMR